MSVTLPLKDMSLREKLAVMETLWDDLARSPESLESPDWHRVVLDERRRRAEEGGSCFAAWDSAKAEIRKRTS